MTPSELNASQFASYPPLAGRLGIQYLSLLQQLPLSFLPSLLRELIDYDYSFPVERSVMSSQLSTLAALTAPQLADWFRGFAAIRLNATLDRLDWVNQPAHFTEDLSAYLWSTHQMDAYRAAAIAYNDRLETTLPATGAAQTRLGIAVIGQGATAYNEPLFTNLRRHGTYFSNIDPQGGLAYLLEASAASAHANAAPYEHWYVDGGVAAPHDPSLTTISYAALATARNALLKNIENEVGKPGMGPEQLRSYMMRMSPADLHLGGDVLLDRFQMRLLTEGSGTQIFSTTFAQWAAREILRRAQPQTLLVRYAPRQRQRPMNEMLSSSHPIDQQLDPEGSLMDGDMGAYYQWIDQQRLPPLKASSFIVWFEDHGEAVAIGPSLPRDTQSSSAMNLKQLVQLATS